MRRNELLKPTADSMQSIITEVKKTIETMKNTFKARSLHELFIALSEGNKKLIPTKEVKFLIWNIPAICTCPYRTALCEKNCYAVKSEKIYGEGVVNSRKKHFEISCDENFILRMVFTLVSYMERPIFKNSKLTVVRIHESGDFYNRRYAMDWLAIAKIMKTMGYDNMVFMAYTKSLPYFEGVVVPENFVIRSSIWTDTKMEYILMTRTNNYPIYTAYTAEQIALLDPDSFTLCKCEDCANCGKCWNKEVKLIIVVIH